MNNQISYAPKAREDLLEIKTFIEEESGDIELAMVQQKIPNRT